MKALIYYRPTYGFDELINTFTSVFPDVILERFTGKYIDFILKLEQFKPDLLLYELPNLADSVTQSLRHLDKQKQRTILITENEINSSLIHSSIVGFIKKPMLKSDVQITIASVIENLKLSSQTREYQTRKSSFPKDIIAIPTMKGFEYIHINQIIRCEGLQKCTRIVTVDRKDIISSYSLGSFMDLLKDHSFYLVHRSHLINLRKIIRYSRDGFIYLVNNSCVPLARRKKQAFLSNWQQLKK